MNLFTDVRFNQNLHRRLSGGHTALQNRVVLERVPSCLCSNLKYDFEPESESAML
jgi:hypothetical protein